MIALAGLLGFNADRSGYRWEWQENQQEIKLTSQVWQGSSWKHDISIDQPDRLVAKGTAVLVITGDRVKAADGPYGKRLSREANLPVYTLFNIPNQPLWEMREDDLIAHTFATYIETGDERWPLLFPMVRATSRAMDAICESTKNSPNPIRKFVVTGASKRGWTTWLIGALQDKRVAGLVPVVFDNLNFAAQLKHQNDLWGGFSPKIADYTRRNLQATLATEEGRRLVQLVDPYAYRTSIKVPVLVVAGSNDPYWTVDAHTQYWAELKMPKSLYVVANRGHDLGGAEIPAICAMAKHLVTKHKLPTVQWTAAPGGTTFTVKGGKAKSVKIWSAPSSDANFADSKFREIWRGGQDETGPPLPTQYATASFAEFEFDGYFLTTQVALKR